jgi:hypothetical protein
VKTCTLPALLKIKDPTWESTDLVIWFGIELSVGVLIAALPPLKKQFDGIFRRLLPSTFLNSKPRSRAPGIPLYDVSKSTRRRPRVEGGDDDDGDSERRILAGQTGKGEITKTVVHEVRSEERDSSVQMPDRTYNVYD